MNVGSFAEFLTRDRLAIFLFHGVVDDFKSEVRNYTAKHLQKDDFAAVLRELTHYGTAISIDEVVHAWELGASIPANSFVITFDDGFANNLHVAAPILADMQVPAVFYLTTGFINDNRMSWIDRIELAVEQTPSGTVRLPWGNRQIKDMESKREFLEEVRIIVKSDQTLKPELIADEVQRQLLKVCVYESDDPLNKKLTWQEVRALDTNPLFTIGGHSHTHPILSFLDEETLCWEVDTSIRLLEENAGVSAKHYSYPEGLAHCFSEEVINVLRNRGVVCSPTAVHGVNTRETDLFHLRRIPVNGAKPTQELLETAR